MDENAVVLEEHEHDDRCHSDSGVSEIAIVDYNPEAHLVEFLGIFWEYWLKVQHEDLSESVEYDILGEKVKVPEAEAVLYTYLKNDGRVKLCIDEGRIIGFLLYHFVFDCVAIVRHEYLESDYIHKNLGRGMVDAISKNVKRVIFQTQVKHPPAALFRSVGKYLTKIHEDDTLIAWEMPWRVK